MIEQAIILAVGHGSHLGVLTKVRTKVMLPVLGKPIVARIMERLREAGVKRFVVIIDEEGGQAAAYLKGSWYPDLEVNFSLQVMDSGTGEALAMAAAQLREGPFFLVSSDVLTPVEFLPQLAEWFEISGKALVVGGGQTQYSQQENLFPVEMDGDVVGRIYPSLDHYPEAAYGAFLVYACKQEVLPYLTGQKRPVYKEGDLAVALQQVIDDRLPVGCMLADWYVRLNHEGDLLTINKYLLQEGRDAHILSELPGSVHIIPPVRIDPQVSVGQGAFIGPNVYLESGCTVGQNAKVDNAVVLSGATIHAGDYVTGRVISRHERR